MKLSQNQKKTILFIVLSVLLHLGLFGMPWPNFKLKMKAPLVVERIILDKEDKKQVVDATDTPQDQTPPKESEYLSKYNQSVEEETKAVKVGKTQNSAPSTPAPAKKQLSMADLGLKPQILEKPRKPSAISPSSTTDDYLPNTQEGAQTALNTREFQFYSYFERIKDRLRMYWEPELQGRVDKIYAKGKNLGEQDLITKLNITLSKQGELSKIQIVRNSGIEDVDEAALKAFEKAAPFPNPPSGMIEKDGTVRLTWSFVVETKGMSNIFVFLSRR